ncbi:MAG: hypothetical protein IH991_24390, partial [Planctomycetes bacterium]|nr:hypothetical protein [Planctomycetota bacterium]
NLTDGAPQGGGLLVFNIDNGTAAIVTFSGTNKQINTNTATGVNLQTNPNGTINFTNGGLDIDTTTGIGFNATSGGTVNVTGANNTIDTTTGTAVNIANTTIGAGGVTFRSISVNGAINGIVLNTTGGSGGLTVTGTGITAGSGGTIQNTTSDGVNVISAILNLNNISLNTIGDDAVESLNSTLNGAGNTTAGLGGLRFNDLGGNSPLGGLEIDGLFFP